MEKNICTFCNERVTECIPLLKGYICEDCLRKITEMGIDDEDYDNVKDKIKELWAGNNG